MKTQNMQYDVVVLGAGSAGLTAAIGFGKAGKHTLLIEQGEMGGECTNAGCIPSKALLHCAKSYYQATTIAGTTSSTQVYREHAFSYVREHIETIRTSESPEAMAQYGVEVIKGEAAFTAPCVVEVAGTAYRYKKAVIATGSAPRTIDIEGVSATDLLTNENLFELIELPARLCIIGSGPIGMEMGEAFAMLGSKVTIVTLDTRIASKEDPEIEPLIKKKFTELGITIHTNASVERADNGHVVILKRDTGETERAAYDKILVAIGRTPNLPKGLEAAKIEFTKHGIVVDSQYRTSNRHVYAIGDVSNPLKFTHTANDSGRAVVGHVLSKGWLRAPARKSVPKVTYTLPEIAQVGISYEEALKQYREDELIRIEVPYGVLDRAYTDNNTDGVAVVTATRLRGRVLGANIAGVRAGELIQFFTIAIDERISLWRLRRLIYAYPTYALLIQKVADQFFQKQLRTLGADIRTLIKKHAPKVVALIFWVTLLVSFQQYRMEHHLTYKAMLMNLYEFFTMNMWGPVIYMGLYAIRPLILFPATLLTALSGVLFGFWWGVLYTLLGENASANFAYWIGRFFGADIRFENTFLGKYTSWLRTRPFESVLFMRLFYVPFDLTNYGSGVLKVPWASYALATLIGILPGLTTFVALGASLSIEDYMEHGLTFMAFNSWYLVLSIFVFVASLLLSRSLRRKTSNR